MFAHSRVFSNIWSDRSQLRTSGDLGGNRNNEGTRFQVCKGHTKCTPYLLKPGLIKKQTKTQKWHWSGVRTTTKASMCRHRVEYVNVQVQMLFDWSIITQWQTKIVF